MYVFYISWNSLTKSIYLTICINMLSNIILILIYRNSPSKNNLQYPNTKNFRTNTQEIE